MAVVENTEIPGNCHRKSPDIQSFYSSLKNAISSIPSFFFWRMENEEMIDKVCDANLKRADRPRQSSLKKNFPANWFLSMKLMNLHLAFQLLDNVKLQSCWQQLTHKTPAHVIILFNAEFTDYIIFRLLLK